jgi:hypothetical protein
MENILQKKIDDSHTGTYAIPHWLLSTKLPLVFLFVGNGIASIITLNEKKKLAENISDVINPAMANTGNFEDMVIESKRHLK